MSTINLPQYFYIYDGLEVVKVKVNNLNINKARNKATLFADYKEETHCISVWYDSDTNQFAHDNTEYFYTFLTYIQASLHISKQLQEKGRWPSNQIYQEYCHDINLCLKEAPHHLI